MCPTLFTGHAVHLVAKLGYRLVDSTSRDGPPLGFEVRRDPKVITKGAHPNGCLGWRLRRYRQLRRVAGLALTSPIFEGHIGHDADGRSILGVNRIRVAYQQNSLVTKAGKICRD